MSLQNWQLVIDVNLTGVFLCAREFFEKQLQLGGKGVCINISSISRNGNMGQTNYTATKAGVAEMTVTWAKEMAQHGVRCAAIAPGYINTEMVAAIREDVKQKIIDQVPIRRPSSRRLKWRQSAKSSHRSLVACGRRHPIARRAHPRYRRRLQSPNLPAHRRSRSRRPERRP